MSASVLLVIVGAMDHFNGREWQILPLYLVPISMAVWFAGRSWAFVFSFAAAVTWLAAEVSADHFHGHRAMPYWNALMLLGVFLVSALLLSNLREVLATLDSRVTSRTTQLKDEMVKRYQAELGGLRAQRLAVVGSMAAQMAHEVRNPMGSISLNMELLAQEISALSAPGGGHSPAEAQLLLSQMEQEFARIDAVIRDYLTFARLPKIVPQPHRLHEYLDQKLSLTEEKLAADNVRWMKDYDPSIEWVNLDPAQMWQVVLNLIRNACEAMPEGGELKVRTRRDAEDIHIAISDTGGGISDADAAKMFTPFFTTKAQGTGLGLALSQQIVAEHGGRLTCHSSAGAGATFTISLPAQAAAAPGELTLHPFPTQPTHTPFHGPIPPRPAA